MILLFLFLVLFFPAVSCVFTSFSFATGLSLPILVLKKYIFQNEKSLFGGGNIFFNSSRKSRADDARWLRRGRTLLRSPWTSTCPRSASYLCICLRTGISRKERTSIKFHKVFPHADPAQARKARNRSQIRAR